MTDDSVSACVIDVLAERRDWPQDVPIKAEAEDYDEPAAPSGWPPSVRLELKDALILLLSDRDAERLGLSLIQAAMRSREHTKRPRKAGWA
jgi:hypothetical protein